MGSTPLASFQWGDHPREYGENIPFHALPTSPLGSSPRIRGKWQYVLLCHGHTGIIPANTGKMHTKHWTCLMTWDHPREYGENFSVLRFSPVAGGSSPRIRGKSQMKVRFMNGLGIIPANTGKIHFPFWWLYSPWDHPREYGENAAVSRYATTPLGSSPRIRGKYVSHFGWCVYAGDHPREYGENRVFCSRLLCALGSSPRIRGKYIHRLRPAQLPGIIPANTGKMVQWMLQIRVGWDHPREYGENSPGKSSRSSPSGSSPRIRGKSFEASEGQSVLGIIPANTGKIITGHAT